MAICQHEYGKFDARQELLDDHFGRRLAKFAGEHLFEFVAGYLEIALDDNAFACGGAVGFEDVWRLQGFEEVNGLVVSVAIESLITRRRDVVAHHKLFCEILAAFELCAVLGGAADEGRIVHCAECVGESVDERHFGAYYHEVNFKISNSLFNALKIRYLNIQILSDVRDSGVARRGV